MLHSLALFGLDLEHVRGWIEYGGYAALFSLLFACGLGLPLPEDIPLIIAGVLIGQHQMRFMFAGPIAWAGIIGGDCMLYRFGRRYGRHITKLPVIGKHITVKRLDRVEELFQKYGVWVVAIGRLFAGIRGAMVVTAGTTHFKFPKFIVADSLAAIVSGGTFMLLGYWFGSNIDSVLHKAHEFKLILALVAIIIAIGATGYFYWRNQRKRTISEVIVEKVHHATLEVPAPSPQVNEP